MAKLYTHTNKNATYSMVANLCVANKQSTRKVIKYCTIYLTIYMAVIMTVRLILWIIIQAIATTYSTYIISITRKEAWDRVTVALVGWLVHRETFPVAWYQNLRIEICCIFQVFTGTV